MQHRLFCRGQLAVALTVAVLGSAGGCGGGAGVKDAGPPASSGAARGFEEIGGRALSEVVSPASYALVRCGYATAEGLRHVDCFEALADAGARADLARVLAAIDEARRRGESAGGDRGGPDRDAAGPPAREPPARTYELAIRERWIADLEVEDRGGAKPATAIARLNGREARAEVEAAELVRALRGLSLAALRASMERPRRPQDWSHEALAGFLGALPGPAAEGALKRELLARFASLPDPTPFAEALLPGAAAFDPAELRRLGRGDVLAVRVLELASAAFQGSREALGEILTLSLEYHGRERLFATALGALFPPASNPDLHARHPVFLGHRAMLPDRRPALPDSRLAKEASLSFIREVHSRLQEARFAPEGRGWTLGSAASPAGAR